MFSLRGQEDQSDGETVVTLAPHRLDLCCQHPRLCRDHLIEAAHSSDIRVTAPPVDYSPLAYHVIHDYQTSWARKPQSPSEVFRVAGLVGVDEEEVKRTLAFGFELGQ